MNSNYGKSNSFDFDLGLNKSGSTSLNDQKNKTSSSSFSSYSAQTRPGASPSWTHQPNKASWTHQPAAPSQPGMGLTGSLAGPTSMVGDILGKSWSSSTPASGMNSGIRVAKKDPNLFGDLLNSALGQNKGTSNVPMKNSAPVSNKGTFSMGAMADSLPKTGNSAKTGSKWGSGESFGSYTSGFNAWNANLNGNVNKDPTLGGQSMKNMASGGGLGAMGSNKDPFGSLVDFKSKPSNSMNSGGKGNSKSSFGDDAFGNFQNAPPSSGATLSSNNFTSGTDNMMGSGATGSYSNINDFGFSNSQPQSQPSVQSTGVTDLDSLFQSTNSSSSGTGLGVQGFESQQFSGGNDWGVDSEFGGGHDTGGTTELEGLPPPPAGVTSATAKDKGVNNYKQGQYADAIKWLSWAVVLLENGGDDAGAQEVLTCRASCYKEVGEYKKAVADCTKALELDGTNVAILVQRALLYESMEKYKLGAEDLRTVLKRDPGNRVAISTIHRLTKMAE